MLNSQCNRRLTWSPRNADSTNQKQHPVRSVTFSRLTRNGKGWRTYTNAVFLSSRRHNLPPKLKIRNNQTIRNVGMWMKE